MLSRRVFDARTQVKESAVASSKGLCKIGETRSRSLRRPFMNRRIVVLVALWPVLSLACGSDDTKHTTVDAATDDKAQGQSEKPQQAGNAGSAADSCNDQTCNSVADGKDCKE